MVLPYSSDLARGLLTVALQPVELWVGIHSSKLKYWALIKEAAVALGQKHESTLNLSMLTARLDAIRIHPYKRLVSWCIAFAWLSRVLTFRPWLPERKGRRRLLRRQIRSDSRRVAMARWVGRRTIFHGTGH